jgi:hypothetical protein
MTTLCFTSTIECCSFISLLQLQTLHYKMKNVKHITTQYTCIEVQCVCLTCMPRWAKGDKVNSTRTVLTFCDHTGSLTLYPDLPSMLYPFIYSADCSGEIHNLINMQKDVLHGPLLVYGSIPLHGP